MSHPKTRKRKVLSLSEALNLFLTHLEVEGKSPHTTLWYRRRLTLFIAFAGDKPASQLALDDGEGFILFLSKRGKYPDHPKHQQEDDPMSRATLRNYVRAIRGFATYLDAEGITDSNVFKALKLPKDDSRVIEILADAEIVALYDQIRPSSQVGSRLFLIVTLLLDTGMRVGELAGIKLDDIDYQRTRIKVTGKGRKQRFVPFGSTTAKALLRYINHYRPASWSDQLLLNLDGEPMTIQAIMQAVKRLGNKAGVPRLHAHLCRHTFAVKWLRSKGDLFTLQMVLGHEDLSVTRMYVHLAQLDIDVQHRAVSPVDRLGVSSKLRR